MPHIHEKIDFGVNTFVVYKDRVLLRKHDKYKIWLPPGGHIELDEDPNQAAVREVKEEVGLDVILKNDGTDVHHFNEAIELIAPRFLNRHRINENHEHIALIYFASAENDHIQQGEREISNEIRWFTKEELDDEQFGVGDTTKYYAKKALESFIKSS